MQSNEIFKFIIILEIYYHYIKNNLAAFSIFALNDNWKKETQNLINIS